MARLESSIHMRCGRERGLTLVELIITIALLSILTSAAVPVTIFALKRDKERELRRDLWEMRDAIELPPAEWYLRGGAYVPDLIVSSGESIQGNTAATCTRFPSVPQRQASEGAVGTPGRVSTPRGSCGEGTVDGLSILVHYASASLSK